MDDDGGINDGHDNEVDDEKWWSSRMDGRMERGGKCVKFFV